MRGYECLKVCYCDYVNDRQEVSNYGPTHGPTGIDTLFDRRIIINNNSTDCFSWLRANGFWFGTFSIQRCVRLLTENGKQ